MAEQESDVPTHAVPPRLVSYRVPPPDWQGRSEAPDSIALSQAMADLGPPPASWPDPDAVPFGTYWLVRFETCRQEVSRRLGRWARREEPMTSRAAAIEYARQLERVPDDYRSITVHEVRLQYQQIYPLGSPSTLAQLAEGLRGLGEAAAPAVAPEVVRQAAEEQQWLLQDTYRTVGDFVVDPYSVCPHDEVRIHIGKHTRCPTCGDVLRDTNGIWRRKLKIDATTSAPPDHRSTALPLPDLRVRAEVTRSRGGVVLRSCPHPKTRAVGGITSWPVYCQGETPQCGELAWDPEAQVWWPREQLAAYEAARPRGSA